MQTQIQIMFELQDAMNTRVHHDWRHQGFKWYRAIWIECAELMDHYGWKWWRSETPDTEQVKLELIDIWHFGLSRMMAQGVTPQSLAVELEEAFGVREVSGVKETLGVKETFGVNKPDDFRELLEKFIESVLVERDFSIAFYVPLLQAVGMDFDDLYRGYVGKNVLNLFRQDHGYQQGTYLKVWNEREDNEHLVELMARMDTADKRFKDELYALLSDRYQEAFSDQT